MDRFSELMGMPVRTHEGNRVGSLCDLTVELGTSPDIRRLALRHGRGPHLYVAWSQVAAFGPDDVRLAAGVSPSPDGLREHEALLGRDVLDTQVIDVAGKRLSRVSDVLLERPEARRRRQPWRCLAAVGVAQAGRALQRTVGGVGEPAPHLGPRPPAPAHAS